MNFMNEPQSPTRIARGEVIPVEPEMLHALLREAQSSMQRRARLCLHQRDDADIQEMVIALYADSYIPPHRQTGGVFKTYYVIEGGLNLFFFDSDGVAVKKLKLTSAVRPICRFLAETWHMVTAIDDAAIYAEVIPGPYRPERTEFAPWAPGRADSVAGLCYLQSINALDFSDHF